MIKRALVLWLALCLTGCGMEAQKRETADLCLVRCIGVDRQGREITATVALAGGEEQPPQAQSRRAPTLTQALEDLSNAPRQREPFYAHTGHVLLGEAAARAGLEPTLDYLARSTELPLSVGLYLVLGEAETLLRESQGESEGPPELLDTLRRRCPRSGLGCVYTAGETAAALEDRGAALILAVEAVAEGEEEPRRIVPRGFGVVARGKYAALLTEEESRGALLLSGRYRGEELALGEDAVLRLRQAAVTWTPVFDGAGRLTGAEAALRVAGSLSALRPGLDPRDPLVLSDLETRAARREAERCLAVLTRQRALGLDFLALKEALGLAAPLAMDRAGAYDEDFAAFQKALDLTIRVGVTLERSFDLTEPLDVTPTPGSGGAETHIPLTGGAP